MLMLTELHAALGCVPLARDIDEVSPGLFRVSTPLRYPDGSFIDVFIEHADGFPQIAQLKVSDLGETFIWLANIPIHPLKSARRKAFLADILRVNTVTHKDGELLVWVDEVAQLPSAVFSVAQASLRVADLLYTLRLPPGSEFQELFTQFLEARAVSYLERVVIETPTRPVEIPYEVVGARQTSLVQLLSARSPSAHQIANDVAFRWIDIEGLAEEKQRVTLLDDQGSGLRSYDLKHLERYSRLVPWSDQSGVSEVLVL